MGSLTSLFVDVRSVQSELSLPAAWPPAVARTPLGLWRLRRLRFLAARLGRSESEDSPEVMVWDVSPCVPDLYPEKPKQSTTIMEILMIYSVILNSS